MLRHVVLFKFTEDTSPQRIQEIAELFHALPGKIPAIRDFEWGADVSVENKTQGFTHCFFLTFASTADRDAYLPHPDHAAFGAALGSNVERVLVLDYWAQK